jgi:hypothetical protein
VTITIDGQARTVSATLSADPGTGKQWPEAAAVWVAHSRGAWYVVSIMDCPEDIPT